MVLKDVLEWLKTLSDDFENFYIGFLDSKKDKSLGVYNLKKETKQIIALGGLNNSSYNVKLVSLLIHWTKDINEAEEVSFRLYDAIQKNIPNKIGNLDVNFIEMLNNSPIDVGRDENGVCEFVIELKINYKREKEE